MEASETTKLNQTHEANRCSSIKKKKGEKKKSSLCIQMRKKAESNLPVGRDVILLLDIIFLDFFFLL